jgi:NitT/TauT family transport system substrate-binding protein
MKRLMGLLVLTLACAAGVSAQAADKLRVGKAVADSFAFTPVDVGVGVGLWPKFDIEPEIIAFGGAARLQQALIAGSVDIALGAGPSMGLTAKGAPTHAIAAITGAPKGMSFVVLKDSPIRSLDQLKGAKMGVTSAGSLTDWLTKRISLLKGWGAEGMTVVAIPGLEATVAALKTHQIDAAVLATESGYLLEERGDARNVVNTGDFVTEFHTNVIFSRDALIASNPELIQRFINGWFTAVATMKADKAKTIEFAAKAMNSTPTVLARVYDEEMSAMSETGVFDPKALAVLKPSLVEMGIVDRIPSDEEMFTARFVPAKVSRP